MSPSHFRRYDDGSLNVRLFFVHGSDYVGRLSYNGSYVEYGVRPEISLEY